MNSNNYSKLINQVSTVVRGFLNPITVFKPTIKDQNVREVWWHIGMSSASGSEVVAEWSKTLISQIHFFVYFS